MQSWQQWFAWRDEVGPLAPVIYDPGLIALSVLIACAGGVAAMQLVSLARRADRFGPAVARGAFALASLALGVSVWAMHFIGMLAADLCQPVRYDPWITALSMLPSVLASAVGLRLYARPRGQERPGPRAIVMAGLWVGAGIGAMHYSGMAALRMTSTLKYDPVGFALSIVVAVGLAIAGLGAREGLRRHTRLPGLAVVVISGCILGLATSGMHYTAMQASLFIGPVDLTFPRWSNRQMELALAVALIVPVVFGFAWGILGIAAYRVMAQRLGEREALLRDIMDNLPGAVVRLRVSPAFERLLVSRSLQDITGRPSSGYESGEWMLLDLVHPQDLPAVHAQLVDVISRGGRAQVQARVRHAQRGWRYVMWRMVAAEVLPGARTPQTVDLYLRDITDEHEARARERDLLIAIDQVMGRAVLSPDGYFVEVNAKLAELLGYEPDDLRGRPHRDVWTDATPEAEVAVFWEALRRGEAQPGEFARRTRDGRTVYLSGWYQPMLDAEGRVEKVLKLAFDVTERVKMVQALQAAQRELQDALASRSAFFANVSHEIRTPMNAIVGFAELLRERLPDGSPEREQARTILESARALLRILNDVLDAAKLERGEFKIVEAPFRLDRLLHDLVSQFGVMAARKGLDLRLELPYGEELAPCRFGDSDRVRQILVNLLGNALKFTEKGHVTLGAAQAGPHVLLWVEDTGIGIAPERQRAIFDPFVQADAGTARRYGGTGLGMSIVKRLTELMGGQVSLSSEVGVGTRVEVRLPLPPRPQADCSDTPAPPSTDLPTLPRPLHVLAADDVAQNRELLQLLLQRAGHRCLVLDSGAALLQHYQDEPARWDAVLLDLHMPGLDGLQTCERLRAFEQQHGLPPVPVFALTASVMDDDRRAARRAGMDGFLEKPIDPQALAQALRQAAWQRHGGVEGAAAPPEAASSAPAPPSALLPVADAARGAQLWGADWLARVAQWAQQISATWADADGWTRDEWHRLAGVAANLALPQLAAAARAAEHARQQGQPADVAAARAAWQRLLAWLADQPGPSASPAPQACAAPAAGPLPAELAQRLLRACQRGEVDAEALAACQQWDAARAQDLQRMWDDFNFEAAARAVRAWMQAEAAADA
ncbi:Autoinducer 2 sensor kinase/phosphatase LuxQ [Tepidimonas alkaliphilus]|uniref:Virulence sensor protein BvgS n=1 Tax=Tepidimonas alkaliphilus TaxID=2588942 RepID=A0A554WB59_9BURK|nr:MHYT domain-containing protein [Tepidimonas alkaliphilus]TSE20818.1 Autoinducer 2 sensor kinase/phosphatase LuxQ [Tepidimonas alkaliphilus]